MLESLLFHIGCYGALALVGLVILGVLLITAAHRVTQKVNGLLLELSTMRSLLPKKPRPAPTPPAPVAMPKGQHARWDDDL